MDSKVPVTAERSRLPAAAGMELHAWQRTPGDARGWLGRSFGQDQEVDTIAISEGLALDLDLLTHVLCSPYTLE
jgi:hypothetical protein